MKPNLHEGHREHIRERFLKTEQNPNNGFQTHELLEMLLFFSIPRANTNETAHLLLKEFGSLQNVFEAPYDALLQVEGIGPKSAFLIRLVSALIHRYAIEQDNKKDSFRLTYPGAMLPIMRPLFFGQMKEMLYMFLFNSAGGLISQECVAAGTETNLYFNSELFVRKALNKNAAMVIFAHNHPQGVAIPSQNDIQATISLRDAFQTIGIRLIEHFILTENDEYRIIQQNIDQEKFFPDSNEK